MNFLKIYRFFRAQLLGSESWMSQDKFISMMNEERKERAYEKHVFKL